VRKKDSRKSSHSCPSHLYSIDDGFCSGLVFLVLILSSPLVDRFVGIEDLDPRLRHRRWFVN
jgi:hypothetical protein